MRGMAAGEQIVSQAQTKEFDAGYERTFGKDRKPVRGRWVMGKDGKLVDANAYVPEPRALDAPIMAGRFYEDAGVATDGTPIDSREKHRLYMKEHSLTLDSDFKGTMEKESQARERFYKEGNRSDADKRQRREDVGRAWYELQKRGRHG